MVNNERTLLPEHATITVQNAVSCYNKTMKNNEASPASQLPDQWDMDDVEFAPNSIEPGPARTDFIDAAQPGPAAPSSTETAPAESNLTDSTSTPEYPAVPESEKPNPAEATLERIAYWREEYDTVEHQFGEYRKQVKLGTLSADARYLASLKRYEEDASFNWQQMQRSTEAALNRRFISGLYATAAAQNYGRGIDPADTIEATSSVFYEERLRALEAAINADSDTSPEEKQAKHRLLNRTWQVVEKYIETTADWASSREGQNARRSAHNDMIAQLNSMNDLAEAYGTPRFTFRNFMKNDFEYNHIRDLGGALNHRAEYDRETVANYFQNVFHRDIVEQQRRQSRRDQLFR